jgi:hypothetical protein
MNQQFYMAIVESRDDPLKLGRVQCRVFGVHSESLEDIPTKSLPWAIPLMPATSASISGIGHSGSQYLEGTMVFVFFQDGESKQQPIILGSAHGIPINKSAFGTGSSFLSESIETAQIDTKIGIETPTVTSTVQSSTAGTLLDSSGQSVLDGSGKPIQTGEVDNNKLLKDALGKKESSNNYKAFNRLGYIGKYQMGAAMLTDLGYVKRGTKNSDLTNPSVWTGKGGVTSRESWLNSGPEQEKAMDAELKMNESRLKKMGVIDSSTTSQEKAGYLATSHLLGTGGARDMKRGAVKADANGVTGQTYYKLGYSAVAGVEPTIIPEAATPDNPSRTPSVNSTEGTVTKSGLAGDAVTSTKGDKLGFMDPNGKYPKHLNEQDTNRLSRNQSIDMTLVPYKEVQEDKGIPIANGKGAWDQSPTPYNATYPYNHVYESESGHVLEFDDSPHNERIQLLHKQGTFLEIDRNGTQVTRIVGDSYEILDRNGYVHIKGNVSITVDGDANILVGNNCELEIDGDLNANITGNANWSVGGSWKVKSGGVHHVSANDTYAVDAPKVDINSGLSTAGTLATPTREAGGSINLPNLILEPRGFNALSDFETDDLSPEDVEKRQVALKEAGLIDENPIAPVVSKGEEVVTKKVDDLPVECSAFVSGNIDINSFISTNFKLTHLTKGAKIPVSQSGLKDVEIACNLKNLATNVLDKIKLKYPDMIITSGLRPMGTNKLSQHPLGMAADIQFTSHKSEDYLNIAKDLASSLSFDQLILEYRSNKRNNGVPTTWIHVSYSTKGNRKMIFTMDNDSRISPIGQLKAVT